MGFGWCWDEGRSVSNYLTATQEYIDFCITNRYSTKIFFTTGPVDDYLAQDGYNKSIDYETIRTYVAANSSRILFDYADIYVMMIMDQLILEHGTVLHILG